MLRDRSLMAPIIACMILAAGSGLARADDNGVIKGKVVFKGDVADHKRPLVDTARDPNCKKSKKKIGSYKVILNKKTDPVTIRNVMVYVKDGLGKRIFVAPTTPVILKQFGCEYQPHVLGIMEGQPLRITNGDDTNHNIHFLSKVNDPINFTQPIKDLKGRDVALVKESTFKVKCDVHGWMSCYIQVFDHPFFAVTGKDGTFEITGLPNGTYTIEAWHETFGTRTATVEVTGDTIVQDFTFEPKQRAESRGRPGGG